MRLRKIILSLLVVLCGSCSNFVGSLESTKEIKPNVVDTPTISSSPSPSVLQKGTIALAADQDNLLINTSGLFDFDSARIVNTKEYENNADIGFNMAVYRYTVPVINPVPPAAGVDISLLGVEKFSDDFVFNYDDCVTNELYYGHGGMPIPDIHEIYCWETNEGNIAEFYIESIDILSEKSALYRIVINFVVWEPSK